MIWILLFLFASWFYFGDPPKDLANLFWENDAAPWETVDAYYYPNRNNLHHYEEMLGLPSVEHCREWVRAVAAINGDSALARGGYECAIEILDYYGGLPVYRTTVR